MAKMEALKALLSKGGDESMALLKSLGAKGSEIGKAGLDKLDSGLANIPGMVAKKDLYSPAGLKADPTRRNALLGALGLGGAGLGAAAMMDEEDEDEEGMLKKMLGL